MSATPESVGQVPKQDEEQGATSAPTATPSHEEELRRLKEENQQLRASRREETARRLGGEHKLPDAVVELLKTVPENEMEEKAKAIAEQLPKSEATTTTTTTAAVEEPPNKEQLARVETAGDAGAKPPELPDRGLSEDAQQIKGKTLEEMARLQQEAHAKLRP